MQLPALKNSLDFVNQHGKANGWNKMASDTKRAITHELDTRFPAWDVPARTALENAAASVAPNPTEGQTEAGNFKSGHVSIQGIPVTIERAQGQTRSGIGSDGKPHNTVMPAHYGRIKRTEAADGEHVDRSEERRVGKECRSR